MDFMDLERARVRKHYQIDPMIADLSFQGWKHKFTYKWELFFDDVLYSLNLEHVSDGVFDLDIMKAYNRKGTSTNKPELPANKNQDPKRACFHAIGLDLTDERRCEILMDESIARRMLDQ